MFAIMQEMILPLALAAICATQARIADPVEFSRSLVELFHAEWPKNRTVTIVCHGHSVPAGYFKTPVVQTFDAYPFLLHQAIKAKFPYAVVNVIVTAIGGEASDRGAERFERDVMSLKPDVVTIDYGLNDRGLGLDKARGAWEKMIDVATKAGVKVILLTPSWDLSSKPNSQDPLWQHAAQIRDLAAKYHVGLADSYAAFLDKQKSGVDMNTLMSQVNHPNRAGHEMIVKVLMPWFGVVP